jgi:hypothetical protein
MPTRQLGSSGAAAQSAARTQAPQLPPRRSVPPKSAKPGGSKRCGVGNALPAKSHPKSYPPTCLCTPWCRTRASSLRRASVCGPRCLHLFRGTSPLGRSRRTTQPCTTNWWRCCVTIRYVRKLDVLILFLAGLISPASGCIRMLRPSSSVFLSSSRTPLPATTVSLIYSLFIPPLFHGIKCPGPPQCIPR